MLVFIGLVSLGLVVPSKTRQKTCACGKLGEKIILKCICEDCLDFIKYAGHKIERGED